MEEEQCIQTGIPMSAVKERDNALIWGSKRRISEQEEGAAVLPPRSTLETTSAVGAGCLSPRGGSAAFLQDAFQLHASPLNSILGAESMVSPVLHYCRDATLSAACWEYLNCVWKVSLAQQREEMSVW